MQRRRQAVVGLAILGGVAAVYALARPGERPARGWPQVADGPFPRAVRSGPGHEFTLAAPPQRIVLASASVVDFALDLIGPERVVGVCEHAFTASALALAPAAYAGVPRHARFLAEPTLAVSPDLVLCSEYNEPNTIAALVQAGVAVVALPAVDSLADARTALDLTARLLGAEEKLAALHADLDRRCAALRARHRGRPLRALCFTHNPTGTWTGGAHTLHDVALELAGLENVAATAGLSGHVALEVESVLAFDPDVIVLDAPTDGGHGSRAQLTEHPALGRLRALRAGAVVELHPALYATGSHRVVAAAETIADRIDALGLREAGR